MSDNANITEEPDEGRRLNLSMPQPGNPGGPGKPGGKKPPAPPVVKIRPLAEPAGMRRRHWGLLASFLFLVVLPLALAGFYLFSIAQDQYSSTVGFTVRSEEGASASDLIGGLAQFAGGSGTGTDGDVLYEFIQSQEIVERIQARVDLAGHYSQYWEEDPLFSVWPEASIEDLLWFWKRVVRISYDQSSGLTELQVLAFDPDMAQRIAKEILAESQQMINALNTAAREDAMRHALSDQEAALARLKEAREALTRYRTRTQIVDPEADIQGRMGVLNNLQQQLAQALIDHDLLTENASSADPRVTQTQLRIEVIRERIERERESFASDQPAQDSGREDYPTLLAEYESLVVDREFAEETDRAALAAVEASQAKAARQSRYLAAYIQPTRAQSSEFPQRGMISGLLGMLLVLSWAILALIYYSIRDRR